MGGRRLCSRAAQAIYIFDAIGSLDRKLGQSGITGRFPTPVEVVGP